MSSGDPDDPPTCLCGHEARDHWFSSADCNVAGCPCDEYRDHL